MMDFDKACQLAVEYYTQEWGCSTLSEIKDLGEKWIFYPTDEESAFANFHITIRKDNGKPEPFILPSRENFELLAKAKAVDVPEAYRSKGE